MKATRKKSQISSSFLLCCVISLGVLAGCATSKMFSTKYDPIPGDAVATIQPYNEEIAAVINELLEESNIRVVQNADKNASNFLAKIDYDMERYNSFLSSGDPLEYTNQGYGNTYTTVFDTFNIPEPGGGVFTYNIETRFKFPNLREYTCPTIKTHDPNETVDMFCLLAAQGLQWIKEGERKRIIELRRGVSVNTVAELEQRLFGTPDQKREKELKPIPKRVVKAGEEPPTTPSPPSVRTQPQQTAPSAPEAPIESKTRYILMSDNSAWILDSEDNQLKLYKHKDFISSEDPTLEGEQVQQWFNENLQNFEGIYPYQDGSVQFGEENNLLNDMVNKILQ